MKNVIELLPKSALIQLGLTASASGTNARIHENILGSGTTTLIYKMMKWKIL